MSQQPTRDPVSVLLADVRRRLLLRGTLQTAAIGLLLACAAVTLLLVVDLLVQLPAGARRGLRWLPALAILPPSLYSVRTWTRWTAERIALLIDERGTLGNIVSTYRSPNAQGPVADAFRDRSSNALASLDLSSVVPLEFGRLWASTIAVALLTLVVLIASGGPEVLSERWWDAAVGGSPTRLTTAVGTEEDESFPTLGAIEFVVRPPSYSGLPSISGIAGDVLTALPGSTIEIRGTGAAQQPALTAEVVGGGPLAPRSTSDGWSVEWTVGPEDRGVTLEINVSDQLVEQRVIPLRLLRDRPPTVRLTAPT